MERLSLLLICDYRPDTASTVCDHINALRDMSVHDIHMLSIIKEIPESLDINSFDGIIIHYSVIVAHSASIGLATRAMLHNYKGLIVMFIQDEYRWVNDTVDVMQYIGVDVLYTCIPEKEIEKVYPVCKLPNTKKINTLTGYVDESLLSLRPKPYIQRDIEIGYRSRKLSALYGSLAREKSLIVDNFKKHINDYSIKCDLSYQETARLYGNDWIRFIRDCRAVLGTESGASVFDFTGEIKNKIELHEKRNPHASYEELEQLYFKGLDKKIIVNQISPRCFEAAALQTMMILYEGEYSGILKPWIHYVPLRKDHENIKEVIEVLRNESLWSEIVDAAYNEVACNPEYSFKRFVEKFDQDVLSFYQNNNIKLRHSDKINAKSNIVIPCSSKNKVFHLARVAKAKARTVLNVYIFANLNGEISLSLKEIPIKIYKQSMKRFELIASYYPILSNSMRWFAYGLRPSALIYSRSNNIGLLNALEKIAELQSTGFTYSKIKNEPLFVLEWSKSKRSLCLKLREKLECVDGFSVNKKEVRKIIHNEISSFEVKITGHSSGIYLYDEKKFSDAIVWFVKNYPASFAKIFFRKKDNLDWLVLSYKN